MGGTEHAESAVLMGRCTECKRAFRVKTIPDLIGNRFMGPNRVLGLPGCDCMNGSPFTPVTYRRLKGTYSAKIACSPGNCYRAKSSICTCSCGGKNHGAAWALSTI